MQGGLSQPNVITKSLIRVRQEGHSKGMRCDAINRVERQKGRRKEI